LNESSGSDLFQFELKHVNGKHVQCYREVQDLYDGTYLFRFRLFESVKDLQLEIKYQQQHIKQSPYIIIGHVYPDDCYCPEKNLTKWYESMDCQQDN
ncbi:unnamed protein product, partial [Didymodactylos carnosus]